MPSTKSRWRLQHPPRAMAAQVRHGWRRIRTSDRPRRFRLQRPIAHGRHHWILGGLQRLARGWICPLPGSPTHARALRLGHARAHARALRRETGPRQVAGRSWRSPWACITPTAVRPLVHSATHKIILGSECARRRGAENLAPYSRAMRPMSRSRHRQSRIATPTRVGYLCAGATQQCSCRTRSSSHSGCIAITTF